MRRQDALTALLSVQAKPKQQIEAPEAAPRHASGGTGSVNYTLSMRERTTIQTNAPAVPQPKTETWDERKTRLRAEGERKRAEAKAAADRERWKKENDERTRKEMAERQSRIATDNIIRAEVRALLADEQDTEILNEVIRRVKAAKMTHLVAAWETFLEQVRAERSAAPRR